MGEGLYLVDQAGSKDAENPGDRYVIDIEPIANATKVVCRPADPTGNPAIVASRQM